MSKQAFDSFTAKLAEDTALRSEMARALGQGGTKATASVDEVIAFAKSQGFDFDTKDVRQSVELTDKELDAVAGGASDMFLKLDGIKGESRSGHQDHIEIHSYSWGVK